VRRRQRGVEDRALLGVSGDKHLALDDARLMLDVDDVTISARTGIVTIRSGKGVPVSAGRVAVVRSAPGRPLQSCRT
jgi:hypothetical protein